MAGRAGHWVVGGDLSAGMLADARRRLGHAPLVQMDVRAPPFRPCSFDAVLAHIPTAARLETLRAYYGLLDNGYLYVSVSPSQVAQGEPVLGEADVGRLLEQAGFRVLVVEPAPHHRDGFWRVYACAAATGLRSANGRPGEACASSRSQGKREVMAKQYAEELVFARADDGILNAGVVAQPAAGDPVPTAVIWIHGWARISW